MNVIRTGTGTTIETDVIATRIGIESGRDENLVAPREAGVTTGNPRVDATELNVVGARAREVALAPDVVLLHPVVFVAALGHGRAPGRAPGLVPGAVTASMWTLSPVLWEVL